MVDVTLCSPANSQTAYPCFGFRRKVSCGPRSGVPRRGKLVPAEAGIIKDGEVRMDVDLDIRSVESSAANEIYISAKPKSAEERVTRHERRGTNRPSSIVHRLSSDEQDGQACEIFTGIADILRSKNACILRERIFAPKKVTEQILRLRSQIYGDLDDRVAPNVLVGKPEMTGPITAVQVHAICSDSRPEVIDVPRFRGDRLAPAKAGGQPSGRILRMPGCTYLTLSSISAGQFNKATEQARAMMEKAESALKQFNSDFFSVARTWMWLGSILSWYGPFNRVRNKFFTERGLISKAGRHSIPASTGIGLGPTDGSKCAMDLIAVLEPRNSIQHLQSAGKQRCALEYGSAFSRASRAITPAGQTIFVSGTASIDASGATTNIDDAAGQINTAIENVRAVLRDTQTTDEDVVQAVAYCKTTEVEQIFNDFKSTLAWPCITVICDICRPDLLFEIEATAIKPAKPR